MKLQTVKLGWGKSKTASGSETHIAKFLSREPSFFLIELQTHNKLPLNVGFIIIIFYLDFFGALSIFHLKCAFCIMHSIIHN